MVVFPAKELAKQVAVLRYCPKDVTYRDTERLRHESKYGLSAERKSPD